MNKILNLLTLIFLIFLLFGCISNGANSRMVATILNDNSDLELNLLQDMSTDKYPEGFLIEQGFGVYSLCNEKYILEETEDELNFQSLLYSGTVLYYSVTAWPDYSKGGFYITQIHCSDRSIQIFGITLDSSIEEIIEVLLNNDYKYTLDEDSSAYNIYKFNNNGININFYGNKETGKLINFIITASVTNRFNIIY